jgi:biopolymer transport protein ExbD
MSMHAGPHLGSHEPELMMDINTTPLIDVMLVLLVMLIITIPIQLHAVNIDLPTGTPPALHIKPEKIQIDIDANNVVHWQGVQVNNAQLNTNMHDAGLLTVQPEVHIKPHKDSMYAVFAGVLAISKRKGLTKIAVVGSEQFAH